MDSPHQSEKWKRLESLFDECAALAPADRPAWFVQQNVDAELRQEVESLLAADEANPEFLDRPAAHLAALAEVDPREADPDRLGPYKVVRRIGAGGMGAVYLAERDDDSFNQRVAIKLLKRGMDSEQILQRFYAERQILAALEHPGITRLIDGGMSEDGRPYFVLEYLEGGVPIDDYCRESKAGLKERLNLFLQACEAVGHAHRKLVVHRDLKPSNLLVTPDGQVKLLDFGIAKLLDPQLAGLADAMTVTGVQVMTPQYASPEQFRSEPVTTASDVYALGVVLYELLTGRPPHQSEEDPTTSLAEAVQTRDPKKPSTVVTPSGAPAVTVDRARLRGDLDNIILKALRKTPERRYDSVDALAEDVRRFLEHRPVLARSQTLVYRMRRFARRHAAAVVAGSIAIAALVGGLIAASYQARIAGQERDRAQAEAEHASEITNVLVGLFDLVDPTLATHQDDMTVREFAELAEDKTMAELSDRPAVRARVETALARVQHNLGNFDDAADTLRRVADEQRTMPEVARSDLIETLHWLSEAEDARNDFAAGRVAALEALELSRESGDTGLLGRALVRVAWADINQGNFEAARTAADEAIRSDDSSGAGESELRGDVLNALGISHYFLHDYESAELELRESARIREVVHGDHAKLASSLSNLGVVLIAADKFRPALEAQQRALEIRRKLLGEEHTAVALSLAHVGHLHNLLGDPRKGLTYLKQALGIRERLLGEDHQHVRINLQMLGLAATTAGEYELAETYLNRAAQLNSRAFDSDNLQLTRVHQSMARLQGFLGRWAESERVARESLRIRLELDSHPLDIAGSRTFLARALVAQDRIEEAQQLLDEVHAFYSETHPDGHVFQGVSKIVQGDLYSRTGKPEEALGEYNDALDLRFPSLGDGHWLVEEARCRIGEAEILLGNTDAGARRLRQASGKLEEVVGPRHPSVLRARRVLAGTEKG